jgi:hypothetical protein
MTRLPASSSSMSEETPLAMKPRSNSIRFRRMSSTQRFVSGVKKAMSAFEYEMKESGDENEEGSSMARDENKFHDSKGRIRPVFCYWIRILFPMGVIVVGSWFVLHHSSHERNVTSCIIDPIKALQNSSSLEDLKHGAVASDHEICSQVGTSILRDGGNAVDAAVATILCLGVANPASSGLGGGAFILIHSDKINYENRAHQRGFPPFHDATSGTIIDSNGKITEVIDCREIAPAAATVDMFATKPVSASSFGGLAVAVPGELRGLELAHARHVSSNSSFLLGMQF